jgi:protein-disulfide isomerase
MIRTPRLFVAVCAALLAFAVAPVAQANEFTPAQRSAVERIVHDYLVAHPEVLQEAMSELEKRQTAAEAVKHKAAVKAHAHLLFSSPDQVTLGNPKGNVTFVEFFDYNCAYCKRAMTDMLTLMKTDPNLKVVLKEFPVLGRGRADAARALAVAKEVGLDMGRLQKDMKSPEVEKTLKQDFGLAEALGLNGTPSYVIGDNVIIGAVGFDALKEQINTARCGKASC